MTTVPAPFPVRLAQSRPVLLDGGLATQLEAQGHELHPFLWSAGLLHTDPAALRQAHRTFLRAGAEVLISASYQASRAGFMNAFGLSSHAADELLRASVQIAREAGAAENLPNTLVAASVGPWGAVRHDGSEYTGRYDASIADLAAFHEERLAVLDDAGADALACETLPNLEEIGVLADLLRAVRTPAWVSFCCRDGAHLSDGRPVVEAAALFRDHPTVCAIGVNCTAPSLLPELLDQLASAAPGLPRLVYPNSGEQYDAERHRWRGERVTATLRQEGARWLAAGARGIGGCCRLGPAAIRALGQAIDERSET